VTTTTLALAAVALAVAVLAGFAAFRALAGARREADRLALLSEAMNRLSDTQAALTGRLAQMAESQMAAHNTVTERLQAQERAVTKFLDERLSEVTRRVGDNLQKAGEKTNETLAQLQARLAVIDSAQSRITELSSSMMSLQNILSNKQARGAIAQTQMEDLIRDMLPSEYYAFQATLSNGKRVDCLINLPNPPGALGIDSKYPLDAFSRMIDAENEEARKAAEREFRRDVMRHIDDIAGKYIVPGETGEFALMFVPSDSIHSTLQNQYQDIVQYGYAQKVIVTCPNSLWAILNAVRALIRDAKIREQAQVLQAEIGKLMEDVSRLEERVGKLGAHFRQVTEDVRQIEVSTGKIVGRGQRIATVSFDGAEPDAAQRLLAADEAR